MTEFLKFFRVAAAALFPLAASPLQSAIVPATFTSSGSVPISEASYDATGRSLALSLGFAPAPGTTLTVVRITGLDYIQGSFDNLVHGQRLDLSFGGITYPFVVNYYGGSGNDLVLQWANNRVFAWGSNGSGQLGNGTFTSSLIPVPSLGSGALADRVITALAATNSSAVALCADGALVTWGFNSVGQLGNNSTMSSIGGATNPVEVDASTALLNKLPVAVSAGSSHLLALCADGTLAAWGGNNYGQLGDGSTVSAPRPVAADLTGALAGKRLVAVAAGGNHSLALCSDGTMATWGDNQFGQLGNNSTTLSLAPVAVDTSGVLADHRDRRFEKAGGSRNSPEEPLNRGFGRQSRPQRAVWEKMADPGGWTPF